MNMSAIGVGHYNLVQVDTSLDLYQHLMQTQPAKRQAQREDLWQRCLHMRQIM